MFPSWTGNGRSPGRANLNRAVRTIVADHRPVGDDPSDQSSTLLSPTDPAEPRLSATEIAEQASTFLMASVERGSGHPARSAAGTGRPTASAARPRRHDDRAGLARHLGRVLGDTPSTVADPATRVVDGTLRRHSPDWIFTRITEDTRVLGPGDVPVHSG